MHIIVRVIAMVILIAMDIILIIMLEILKTAKHSDKLELFINGTKKPSQPYSTRDRCIEK